MNPQTTPQKPPPPIGIDAPGWGLYFARLESEVMDIKGDVRALDAKVDTLILAESARAGAAEGRKTFKVSLREWSALVVAATAVLITVASLIAR